MTLLSRINRFYRRFIRPELHQRDIAGLHAGAIAAGTLPCPHCRDLGPHEDNSGLGGDLIFQCRLCRSRIRMKTYDWTWAWNQPLSDYGKDRS